MRYSIKMNTMRLNTAGNQSNYNERDETMAECGTFEIAEPERYRRHHLTKAPPLWLINGMCRCIFGWFLETFRWEQLPDGRWKTETCWLRIRPWVEADFGGGTIRRFQIYEKMKLPTVLRLLWLLLFCQWFGGAGREVNGNA